MSIKWLLLKFVFPIVGESIPRQVDKKSRFPEEEALEGALEEEIGVWNSKGGGNDKCLFPFSLYNPSF